METKLQMKDLDDDGFELKFEDGITKEDKEYYVRAYPNVNMIADRRVHCTSCDGHIGIAPASGKILRMHPILQVTQCKRCDQICRSREYEKDEDGNELYCRWCGRTGDLYCCSNCVYGFCKKCILRNLSHYIQDIKDNQYWECFACAPESILPLRAQYWALANFFEKQKVMIERQAQAGRCYTEIENALNHDSSTCCANLPNAEKSKKIQLSGFGGTSSNSNKLKNWRSTRNKKRRRIENSEDSADNTAHIKTASLSFSNRLSDVTMDTIDDSNAIELISDSCDSTTLNIVIPESPELSSPIIIDNECSENVMQKEKLASAAAPTQTHTFLVSVTTTSDEPIIHRINGHRIELNAASQQNSIQLSDGKIIHVRKLSTVSNAQQTPTIVQSIPIQQTFGQQITQFQSFLNVNSLQAQQPLTNSSISYCMQSTDPWLGPRKYDDSPVGNARTQFERQIFDGLEICQSTEVKFKTLMNSNAYKTVCNMNDVKELLIHMSYLLTYTLDRFKKLQNSCIDDVRQLGFQTEADSLSNGTVIRKNGDDSNVNEVEIVEPLHTTISLDDSDDEQLKTEFEDSGTARNGIPNTIPKTHAPG